MSALPAGWEEAWDEEGRPFFIDHNNETTTYDDPRAAPQSLPEGWEEATDDAGNQYSINHNTETTTYDDPRAAPPERRVAPDGKRYTMQEFRAFYGGKEEWDAAASVEAEETTTPGGDRWGETCENGEAWGAELPEGWEQGFDEDGAVYYFDSSTGESQYEWPDARPRTPPDGSPSPSSPPLPVHPI